VCALTICLHSFSGAVDEKNIVLSNRHVSFGCVSIQYFLSTMSWRKLVICQWDDDEVRFVLDYYSASSHVALLQWLATGQ
jgi:hypothetical protein